MRARNWPGARAGRGLGGLTLTPSTLLYSPKASVHRSAKEREWEPEGPAPLVTGERTQPAPFAEQARAPVKRDCHLTLLSLSPGLESKDRPPRAGDNIKPPAASVPTPPTLSTQLQSNRSSEACPSELVRVHAPGGGLAGEDSGRSYSRWRQFRNGTIKPTAGSMDNRQIPKAFPLVKTPPIPDAGPEAGHSLQGVTGPGCCQPYTGLPDNVLMGVLALF